MRFAMVVDTQRCIGCHTCSVACKQENNLPNGIWWNRVITVGGEEMDTSEGRFPDVSMQYITINCQHCENPACVEACPTSAAYKRAEDGIVMQDYDMCIGCCKCMDACPYNARSFIEKEPEYAIDIAMGDADAPVHQHNVVEKCTFCSHRLDKGELPACVGVCPARARFFGDIDDPDSDVSKALQDREYTRMLEDEGTGPNIYYTK